MVTQEQANHYRGNIIDVAIMIESNIDKFFLDFFVADGDDVRLTMFMELFINVLTFGHKVDKFNSVVTGYGEFDEERCKYVKSSLVEFKKLRNELAHRKGYVNDDGNFLLFAFGKDDVELSDKQITESIEQWTVFAYEFESFASNFLHWIFEED